jgi:hypothetical protein
VTVATQGGSEVAPYEDNIGLEDVDQSDLTIPRIRIIHKEGKFQDNLTNTVMDELDCILLGVVKQRVMFHKDVDESDRPMCKSPDFQQGFPNESEEQPKNKRFPWAKSNFNRDDFAQGDNRIVLPCKSCIFAQWDKGDWKQPPCAEQHTYILYYTPDGGESWSPGLFTVQKSGIKPSRTYLSGFANQNKALFTVRTRVTLKVGQRAQVIYSVPTFIKGAESDRDRWDEFANTYRTVRDVIRQPPRSAEDYDDDGVVEAPASDAAPAETRNQNAPAPTAQPATPAPASEPAPAATSQASADAADMPF